MTREQSPLGTELIADEDAEFVLAQTTEPGRFHAQLGKPHGNVALRPGGADAKAGDITQGAGDIGGKGSHGLADCDEFRHG